MTATLTLLEARCTRCWNSNCFPVEQVGTTQPCRQCGAGVLVPEATPERITRAEALMAEQPEIISPQEDRANFDRPLSDREIDAIVRKESYLPLEQMDFSGYPIASITSRVFAHLIDQTALFLAIIAGLVTVVVMAKYDLIEDPFETLRLHRRMGLNVIIVSNCFAVMFVLCQWVLLATSGQTVGKKLMMIRIVTVEGRLPGFLQSVILRNWVRNLLYMLPLVWLIDYLFLLGESKRTGHDIISGTRVIALV